MQPIVVQMYVAYQNGIAQPYVVMKACEAVGLPFYAACALLEKESSGGKNIFGHDPTIFINAGAVTKTKYLDYKKLRDKTGKVQGVGPCQLTSKALQDEADALGGCWDRYTNMIVGFKFLKKQYDLSESWSGAGMRYNGSKAYGTDFAAKCDKWKKLFS